MADKVVHVSNLGKGLATVAAAMLCYELLVITNGEHGIGWFLFIVFIFSIFIFCPLFYISFRLFKSLFLLFFIFIFCLLYYYPPL